MQLGPVAITLEAIGITLVRMCVCVCAWTGICGSYAMLCYQSLSRFRVIWVFSVENRSLIFLCWR